jgi:hypothetical protein
VLEAGNRSPRSLPLQVSRWLEGEARINEVLRSTFPFSTLSDDTREELAQGASAWKLRAGARVADIKAVREGAYVIVADGFLRELLSGIPKDGDHGALTYYGTTMVCGLGPVVGSTSSSGAVESLTVSYLVACAGGPLKRVLGIHQDQASATTAQERSRLFQGLLHLFALRQDEQRFIRSWASYDEDSKGPRVYGLRVGAALLQAAAAAWRASQPSGFHASFESRLRSLPEDEDVRLPGVDATQLQRIIQYGVKFTRDGVKQLAYQVASDALGIRIINARRLWECVAAGRLPSEAIAEDAGAEESDDVMEASNATKETVDNG